MPQKFEQMQSAEQKHDEDETIAQAGTQIDDTVDALDAVLDDIESVLGSNAEDMWQLRTKKAASDAAAA